MTDASGSNGFGKRLDRLENNMFHGNGKPGITTRMENAENAIVRKADNYSVSALEVRVTTLEKNWEQRSNRLFIRMNILIGGFVSLTVALIVWMVKTAH